MPDVYIYAADLWCRACGEDIRQQVIAEGKAPQDPDDEETYDSDDFPKAAWNAGLDPSDGPDHCGAGGECLDPCVIDGVRYGAFLENPLTAEGEAYVRQLHRDRPDLLTLMWMDYYELHEDDDDDDAIGVEGAAGDEGDVAGDPA